MLAADIAFYSVASFLLGIASASLEWNVILSAVFLVIAGAAALFFAKRGHLWKFLGLFALFLFAGAFYFHLYLNIREGNEKMVLDENVSFSGIISDEPLLAEKYQSFNVELQAPFKGFARIITSPQGDFRYGDLLKIDGKIEPRADLSGEPAAAFPEIEIAARHKGFWLKEKLLDFKLGLLNQFHGVLGADEAALLGGVTFGSRSGFSAEFKKQMSLSGTTHLVALSGYNITVLVFALGAVFGYFLSRRKTFYLTIIAILLFVLMVGAEASVVRAAIMGFLALAARELGRMYSLRNAIVFAAFIMSLAEPTVLIYNIGFQLSFLSLLGIVYLGPAVKNLLRFKEEGFAGWRENLATTASAQLAVMPLIIGAFGQFSFTAIAANVLILGFVPLTMFLGFLLAAVNSLYFYLGFAIAKLAELLLAYEIGVIKFFALVRLPLAANYATGRLLSIIYYGALIILIKSSRRPEAAAAKKTNP